MEKRKQSLLILAVIVLMMSCSRGTSRASDKSSSDSGGPDQSAAATTPSPTSSGASNKLALLMGINHYLYPDRVSPLAGSLNDVEEMRQLLIGKFEFAPENIVVLTESKATHAGIISAIQDLIARAHTNDIVVVHYSGHGSQMKDVTGKMINGMDETIVPYDSRDPARKVFDISGAELHPLLLQLAKKTRNLTFILDSCHSGTLVRGARVRGIEADTRTPPPLPEYSVAATRGLSSSGDEAVPKFATIAAATSRESAFEYVVDNIEHGALTYCLVRQLRAAKAGATYRDAIDAVSGEVTANFPNQHVSLEGVEADQYIFGDGSSVARSYVVASPSLITPHRVTLNVGAVEGASVGSTYDIYRPGSKKFAPPEQSIARVALSSVDAFTSEAAFTSGNSIPQASRAVEREHRFGKLRVSVFLDGAEKSTTLQSIGAELQQLPNVQIVDKPWVCNMQLREEKGKIETLGADSSTLSTPVPVNSPGAIDRVVGQVKSWAKWFSIFSIRNPHSDIQLQFTIAGSQTRDPMARVGKPDMGVRVGETVEATLENSADRDVYVVILDLSTDGSISVVYPTIQGTQAVLKPNQKLTRTFRAFVPAGRSTVYDILKVFASFKPLDLTPLTQGAIRGPGEEVSDPLQALLEDSTGTRGLAPILTKPADLGTWTSIQRVLMVKK